MRMGDRQVALATRREIDLAHLEPHAVLGFADRGRAEPG